MDICTSTGHGSGLCENGQRLSRKRWGQLLSIIFTVTTYVVIVQPILQENSGDWLKQNGQLDVGQRDYSPENTCTHADLYIQVQTLLRIHSSIHILMCLYSHTHCQILIYSLCHMTLGQVHIFTLMYLSQYKSNGHCNTFQLLASTTVFVPYVLSLTHEAFMSNQT